MRHIVGGAHVICVSVRTFKFDNVKTRSHSGYGNKGQCRINLRKESQAPIKFNGLWPIVQKYKVTKE